MLPGISLFYFYSIIFVVFLLVQVYPIWLIHHNANLGRDLIPLFYCVSISFLVGPCPLKTSLLLLDYFLCLFCLIGLSFTHRNKEKEPCFNISKRGYFLSVPKCDNQYLTWQWRGHLGE